MKSSHKQIRTRIDAITPRNSPCVPMNMSGIERRDILVRQMEKVKSELSTLKKGSIERRSLGETFRRLEDFL